MLALLVALVVFGGVGLLVGRLSAPPAAGDAGEAPPTQAAAPQVWTCSMHPQIQLPEFGACPLCAMDLIPLEPGAGDQAPRELTLSPHAAALAEIQTVPAERRDVAREVRMVGLIDYDETRLNTITAWVSGRLDRLYVDYTGTRVRPGDHLVEIYSPELLSAQEELLQALVARRKIQDSESRLLRETGERTVASAREKLRLWGLGADQIAAIERTGQASERITIRAPIGGVVVHKRKNLGDYVQTGERLYTIADLSRVWVKLDAYESDLPWIRYGQTVRFEVEALPGPPREAQVVFVDPVLSGETRTVKVRLNVDNQDGRLKPGMFVRAVLRAPLRAEGQTLDPALADAWICPMHGEVIKEDPGSCDACGMALVRAESLHRSGEALAEPPLVVPAGAVLWTGARSLVYVRLPGEEPRFEGREVVLGPRAGDAYVIRSGLREGERVVVRGNFKLDSALQIEARPSMMLPGDDAVPPRLPATGAFLAALAPIYADYLRVQEALANDALEETRRSFASLAPRVKALNAAAETEDVREAWRRLAPRLWSAAEAGRASSSLSAAREQFLRLSQAALRAVRRFGPARGSLHEAYCPMAFDDTGAAWLQAGEELANPYFGAAMLRCGELRETFAADAAPEGPR